ncbi:Cyclin-D1-binding protein 1 [Mactra antiquata]
MASCEKSSTIWQTFIDNLKHVIDQIQDGEGKSSVPEDFNYKAYWKKLGDVFKAVSHEATKLSIAYSRPPPPSNVECESLLRSVERSIMALMHVYSNLPKTAGLTLRKQVKLSVRRLVEGIQTLAETIQKYSSGSCSERYQSTGLVWEESDKFLKLPEDNKAAVLIVLDRNIPMIDDAHTEINEALNCNEDDDGLDEFLGNTAAENDHKWTESDKTLVQHCLGLIKCCKSLLKKTRSSVNSNGNCDSIEKITQLDDLADRVERLSPVVDELASSIYPPLNNGVVHKQATDVSTANQDLIDFLRHSHVTTEDDMKWLNFLVRANTHNLSKLNSLMPPT